MPIEHKAQRPSSRLLAHLNWLLDEALEQTFPASDPVAIDIDRESHDREVVQLCRRCTLPCTPLFFFGTDSIHSGSPFVGEPYIRLNGEICLVRSYDLFCSNRPVFRCGVFVLRERDLA